MRQYERVSDSHREQLGVGGVDQAGAQVDERAGEHAGAAGVAVVAPVDEWRLVDAGQVRGHQRAEGEGDDPEQGAGGAASSARPGPGRC